MRLVPLLLALALALPGTALADRWGRPAGLDATSPFRDTCRYDKNCGAKRVSDAVLAGSFGVGLAAAGLFTLERIPYANSGLQADPIVVGEPLVGWGLATLPSLLSWQFTRAVQKRPRPFTYDPDYIAARETDEGKLKPATQRNHNSSFFSGHTTLSAANFFYLASMMTLDEDHRPFAAPLFVGAAVGTIIVGASRVQAGYHFVSDVAVGGLVGAGFGIAGPILAREMRNRIQAAREEPLTGTNTQQLAEVRVVIPLFAGTF